MFSEGYGKMMAKKKPRKMGMKLGGRKPPLPMSGWGKDKSAGQAQKEPPEDQDADDKYA